MYLIGPPRFRPVDRDKVTPAEPGFELLTHYGEGDVGRKPIIGWANGDTPVIEHLGGLEPEDVPVIKHPNGCVIRNMRFCWGSEADWLAAEQATSERRERSLAAKGTE